MYIVTPTAGDPRWDSCRADFSVFVRPPLDLTGVPSGSLSTRLCAAGSNPDREGNLGRLKGRVGEKIGVQTRMRALQRISEFWKLVPHHSEHIKILLQYPNTLQEFEL